MKAEWRYSKAVRPKNKNNEWHVGKFYKENCLSTSSDGPVVVFNNWAFNFGGKYAGHNRN